MVETVETSCEEGDTHSFEDRVRKEMTELDKRIGQLGKVITEMVAIGMLKGWKNK